jgi:regulator of nucleoside diphosphate kinase
MNEDIIFMSEKDLLRIKHVLSFQHSKEYENLEIELDRAKIISDNEIPPDLVTMNSKIKFLNVQDNKEMIITIVYPSDANFSEGKISVLASLGSALIGLRANQEIKWQFPDGKTKTLKLLEVLYQPEANGQWHL